MASREKEDEKNEKIIRGLLKLPANRRCINCNSLGPQYVCTNFWTFICINCSGIHREFTHRVKSISLSKFTSQEVSALQEGGNQCAKEIYFKEWDPQRNSFPDNSNIDRLKEFIKHVYVDRRYTGERSFDRSPRAKGDTEDSYDKKVDSYRGSRRPPYDDTDGRRYGEPGSASPAHNYKRSPGRFGIVDERGRDDKPGYRGQDHNVVDQQFTDGPKLEGPSHQHPSNPPKIQSVVVVNKVPPTTIGEPEKSSGIQLPHSSAQVQSMASSSSRGSNIGNSVEKKLVSSASLIDFDADPVPPVAGAVERSVPQQTASMPAESGGWASFDDSSPLKMTQVASAVSTPESVLSPLSVPRTAPAANATNLSISGVSSFPNQSNAGQWPTMQQQQLSLFQAPNVHTNNQPFSSPIAGAPNNQLAPNLPGFTTTPTSQSSQVVNKPLHETTGGVSLHLPTQAKPSGRKELPADLFTMIYPSISAPYPGYQTSQHLMGYGIHYPTAVSMPTYSYSSTSTYPFAIVNEQKSVHASTFPNLASLQGALPNVDSHSSVLHTSSFPTQQWLPQQQIHMPAVPQSPYIVQQGASPMPQPPPYFPVMHQGTGGAVFNFPGSYQRVDARNYQPGAPNSFAPGGNPFG